MAVYCLRDEESSVYCEYVPKNRVNKVSFIRLRNKIFVD